MNIGVVTRIDDKYMLVMANMGIEKIKPRSNATVGMKIEYSRKDIYIGFNQIKLKYIIAVLLLLLLAVLSTFVLFAENYEDAYAVVSIDINPSLELYMDENNRVMGYHAFNDEAKRILNEEIVSLHIQEALQVVIIAAQDHHYLLKDDMILISLTINNENNKVLFIEELIKEFALNNEEKYRFIYVKGTNSFQDRDHTVSFGRQLLAEISGIEITEANKISVKKLVQQSIPTTNMDQLKSFEISVDHGGNGKTEAIVLMEKDIIDKNDIETHTQLDESQQENDLYKENVYENTQKIKPESPSVDQSNPEAKPESPRVDQSNPEAKPESPRVDQGNPEAKPESPGVDQGNPEAKPESPGVDQGNPEPKPESPGVDQGNPEPKPESPGVDQGNPEAKPESPGVDQGNPEVKPESPGVDQGNPEAKPESPGVDKGKPEIKPENPEAGQGIGPEVELNDNEVKETGNKPNR